MNILYILLGWFLGILSPGITTKISNHYKKAALQRTIISEMKDIKIRLAGIPMTIHPAYGTLDMSLFKWVQEQTQNFTDFISDDNDAAKLEAADLENDDKIAKVIEAWNYKKKSDNPSFHFKKMDTSIADSNLINIEILDNNFIKKLLEIKFQIRAFNEEVQSVNEYSIMTFDSNMSGANHQIIQREIKQKNYFISKKAIYIVEKINSLVEFKKSRS